MNYKQLKNKQAKEFDDFAKENMFFAFSEEQFKNGLKKFDEGTKFVRIPAGGFLRKDKVEEYKALSNKHDKELNKNLKDDVFLKSAFIYEMNNREFCITGDVREVLHAIGLDKLTSEQTKIFQSARAEYSENVIC